MSAQEITVQLPPAWQVVAFVGDCVALYVIARLIIFRGRK